MRIMIFKFSLIFTIIYSQQINFVNRQTDITRAIESVENSVVGINVTQLNTRSNNLFFNPWQDFFNRNSIYKVESSGSGVIISIDGYIVTNAHVVENALEINVMVKGGEEYKASLIGIDYPTDIALLKIEAQDLQYIKFGDSDQLILGEWVIALGNPLGLFSVNDKATATIGILSGMNMDFGLKESGRVYQNMLQTDAAINSGNSGGPLINILGELIGINTFIMTGSGYNNGSIGIGFAIPINLVKEVTNELKVYGKVERSFQTGISVQPVDRYIQKYLRLPNEKGVIVTDVEKFSSGEKAGIKIGDIILKVDNVYVNSRNDILNVISENLKKTGEYIDLSIWRNGEEKITKLLLSEGD